MLASARNSVKLPFTLPAPTVAAMQILGLVLLLVLGITGLVLIPLGLPGLWVMVAGVLLYAWLSGFATIGPVTIIAVLVFALLGEVIESWLGFRFARRYGGSSRSGWGALVGGVAGAIIGVPVAIVGSVIGAFLGAFVGAAAFEYSASRSMSIAGRAGWGAVVGRAAAAATKIALGLVILLLGLVAAITAP